MDIVQALERLIALRDRLREKFVDLGLVDYSAKLADIVEAAESIEDKDGYSGFIDGINTDKIRLDEGYYRYISISFDGQIYDRLSKI